MGEGFTFHLLGVAASTLIAGPALALIGSAIVVTILMLVKGGVWPSAALAWCTMAALPVAVTWAMLRFAERRLPPNFFVYVLSSGSSARRCRCRRGLAGAVVLTLGGGRRRGWCSATTCQTRSLAFGEGTLSAWR